MTPSNDDSVSEPVAQNEGEPSSPGSGPQIDPARLDADAVRVVLRLRQNGYEAFLQGRPPASGTAIRMSARLSASHPGYLWLNRLHCLGIGQAFLERAEVAYDVYAVR